MDFFKLLKYGNYNIEEGSKFLWDCWPDSNLILLKPEDGHVMWVTYNAKTLFVHEVVMTIDTGYEDYMGTRSFENTRIKTQITCRWQHPESKKLYQAHENYELTSDNTDVVEIEDEAEMDFITLKLKYV